MAVITYDLLAIAFSVINTTYDVSTLIRSMVNIAYDGTTVTFSVISIPYDLSKVTLSAVVTTHDLSPTTFFDARQKVHAASTVTCFDGQYNTRHVDCYVFGGQYNV